MPPKKDAKKGAAKELDPSVYIRKAAELDEIQIDPSTFEQLSGRIANVSTLFPVWDDKVVGEEKWAEPLATDKKTIYPQNLGVDNEVNILKFLNLEPIEVAVDPKAKKDAKKDPKKGAPEALTELTEVLVDEHGRRMPTIFKEQASDESPEQILTPSETGHLTNEIPRAFGRAYTEAQVARCAQQAALSEAAAGDADPSPRPSLLDEAPLGGEVDPLLCGAFRLVERFTNIIAKAHLNSLAVVTEEVEGAEKSIEDERHILEGTFLWRAIYPKLPSGKPVFNPAGKYCVRLYLAGSWRRVYVDDSVPTTADGTPAVACSSDRLELWPMLLAKAIYAVHAACGYAEVVSDALLQPEEGRAPASTEGPGERSVEWQGQGQGPYPPSVLPRAQCAAHFTAFVLHVLTGWQPRAPISFKKVFGEELSRSAKLLQAFSVEGVSTVAEDDVVRDRDEPSASDRAAQALALARRLSESYSGASLGIAGNLGDAPGGDDDSSLLLGPNGRSNSPGGRVHRGIADGDGVWDGECEGAESDMDDLNLGNIAEGSQEEHSTVLGDYSSRGGADEAGTAAVAVIEPPDDGIVRRTKKQFKAEYQRRKAHRDAVVARILERERRIAQVTRQLEALLTEVFFVCLYDPAQQSMRTLPVLAVSYPTQYKTHLPEVQLLVHWRPGTPQETPFSANPTPEDPETAAVRGVDEGPLPRTTPLEYEWLTVQQLIDANAFLMSMDTKMLTPFDTTFSNPWVPLSSLAQGGSGSDAKAAPGKDKEKEKAPAKGKAVAEAPPVVDEYFADPGMMPVTLLRINTSEFFTHKLVGSQRVQLERQSSISMSGKHRPLKPEVRRVMRQGAPAETAAALRDQQLEADLREAREAEEEEEEKKAHTPERSPNQSPSRASVKNGMRTEVVPVADFLHFTVMVHADAVLQYREPSRPSTGGPASASASSKVSSKVSAPPPASSEEDGGVLTESQVAPKKPRHMLPSNITLVLQEVRTDTVEPLMYVMELKQDAYMPILSKSFAVSTRRLSADPSQPLLFWMRLFSKASVYMHFSSEVGVSVGPAEQIWAGLGRAVFLKEGRCEATRSQTQQLIFRLPLVCDAPAAPETETEKTDDEREGLAESKGGEGEGQGEVEQVGDQAQQESSADEPAPPQSSLSEPFAAYGMTFLQVADRAVDRYLSLGLLPPDSTQPLAPLPRTQGNVVRFSADPTQASTLLGRSYPSALYDHRAAASVPAFAWKLLILSDVPIKEPVKPINEETVTQRYQGKFVANNKNALFRDIYTVDKLSFPVAFRLTTVHDRPVTGSRHAQEHAEHTERKVFAGLASESARKALRQALTVKGKRKDLCLSVKLYRAADMKLVTELKGRESVICYHLALDPFLPDGETFDVAAALAAAAEAKAGAGGKAGKAPAAKPGAKGAAPPSSDLVDILVECTLDEEAMQIDPDWQSRFPHVFDCLFPDTSRSPSAKPAAAMAEAVPATPVKKGDAAPADPEEAARKNMEVVAAQHECLGVAPPSRTLLKWQLDVLAGRVLGVSHDTARLLRELAVKNAWEDASAGRAERAAAALRYYQERRAGMKRLLDGEGGGAVDSGGAATPAPEEKASAAASAAGTRPGTRPGTSEGAVGSRAANGVVPLTTAMTESLTTALSTSDADAINRRYTVLHNIPSHYGRVEILQQSDADTQTSFVRPRDTSDGERERELRAQLAAQRLVEGQRSEARHQDLAGRFVKLNAAMRDEARQRVDEVVKEAYADAAVLAAQWEAREKYRLYVEAQNASLSALLKRAADAKAVARAAEKKAADEAAALAEKQRKEQEKKDKAAAAKKK